MSKLTYIYVLLALTTLARAELICPGYGYVFPQQPCVNQCSPDNDNCETGKKCCYTPYTPCGYRCLDGKNNITKSGQCPSTQSEQTNPNWYLCDGHFCDVDSDCPCKKKCCANKCGSKICISAVKLS